MASLEKGPLLFRVVSFLFERDAVAWPLVLFPSKHGHEHLLVDVDG